MPKLPKYREIFEDLRRRIEAGEFDATGQLPVLDKLAAEYGASMNPLRRALDRLDEIGLIEGHQGKAVYVRRPVTGSGDQA